MSTAWPLHREPLEHVTCHVADQLDHAMDHSSHDIRHFAQHRDALEHIACHTPIGAFWPRCFLLSIAQRVQ